MTNLEIDQKIIGHITNRPSYTLFLLKHEFTTRQYKKVEESVKRLEAAEKLHLDKNLFLKIGPKPAVDQT